MCQEEKDLKYGNCHNPTILLSMNGKQRPLVSFVEKSPMKIDISIYQVGL